MLIAITLFSASNLATPARVDSIPALPKDSVVWDSSPKTREWIGKTDSLITLRLTLSSETEQLSSISDETNVFLNPNASSSTHLAFSYRWISLSFNVIPRSLRANNDDALRGKTTGRGFGFSTNFRHWQQALSYNRTRGYYLENTADFLPDWKEGDPYIQLPNLVLTSFQGVTAYNFNTRFSVNAVTTQTERQRRSAGSFIPLLLYRYYILDDRSTPMPGVATARSGNLQIMAGAGYHHTFVVKDFYFSLGLTPGFGYIFTKADLRYPAERITTRYHTPAFRMDARTGLGYNGYRFFAGAYMSVTSTSNQQPNAPEINGDAQAIFRLSAGYRFRAPAFVRQQFDKVNELIREKTGF